MITSALPIEQHLELLTDGQPFELRALVRERGRDHVLSGYFTAPSVAAREILKKCANAHGVYATLNPVKPECRARCADRLETAGRGATTSDRDISRRTRLLVDVDVDRPANISSSDAEHAASLGLAWRISADLHDLGWPDPIFGDSGNGAHLVYGIELATDDDGLIKRVLESLQARYGSNEDGVSIKIDTSVHNPSRITKIFGTWARKGDDIPERPHRLASIFAAPETLTPVTREQLEALAMPASERAEPTAQRFDIDEWLARFDIAVRSSSAWQGGVLRVLETCPYNPDHTRGEACVISMPSGAVSANCKHESCTWGWAELRERFEPAATRGDSRIYDALLKSAGAAKRVPPTPLSAKVTTMSDVVIEQVEWLWPARIPFAMLTLIDGDPGVGKSTVSLDIASRITRGRPMPFEVARRPPSDVVLLGAEDHLAATVAPRLRAAGADLARVHSVVAIPRPRDPDAPPHLGDVAAVELVIAAKKAALVVVDPLMAFLPPGTDAHKDSEMRAALAPWAAMAARTGASVVLVRHLRKGGGSALHRGGGSVGIVGAARSALLVGKDREEKGCCILAHSKGNLAPPPSALRYRIVDRDGVGCIEWLGTSTVTADELAEVSAGTGEDDPVEAVTDALRELLADGPRATSDVLGDVRQRTGASPKTIERARARLGITAEQVRGKDGRVCGWVLALPTHNVNGRDDTTTR